MRGSLPLIAPIHISIVSQTSLYLRNASFYHRLTPESVTVSHTASPHCVFVPRNGPLNRQYRKCCVSRGAMPEPMAVQCTSRNHDGCSCTVCSQVEHLDGSSSCFHCVSDIGQPHGAEASSTHTMMGACRQHARRWNIETVCQTLDSLMLR